MAGPLVSVVVPTYYRNDLLRRAVESVHDQTVDRVEVVVVDDSGEGHAAPVADEYDVRYVELPENRGGNPARNAGLERATGEYVQFLDDDDRLHPTRLERAVDLLGDADAGVAYCGFAFESADGRPLGERRPDPERRGEVLEEALAFEMAPCVTSTMVVDAAALAAVTPLADRPGADDLGLIIDLAGETAFEFTDEVLVSRSVDPDSRGKSMGVVRGRRQILEEYDDRYRRYPSARRRAVADTLAVEGRIRLAGSGWTAAAVDRFGRAFQARPGVETGLLLGGALLGEPGLHLADRALGRLG